MLLTLAAPLFSALAILFAPPPGSTVVCASCVKTHVEHLADPTLQGRRCTTASEAEAARYLVGELKTARVSGGLPGGGYLQTVGVSTAIFAKAPTLTIGSGPAMTNGHALIVTRNAQALSGPLVRVTDAKAPPAGLTGAVVFFDPTTPDPTGARTLARSGAKAVISIANKGLLDNWAEAGARALPSTVEGAPPELTAGPTFITIRPEAAEALRASAPGTVAKLDLAFGAPSRRETHNVVGVIHGSAPDADRQAVLLTAHYDHLGVRDGKLFPGANDDASGTAAVLEFARLLKAGMKPKRTVFFAMFGCEEEGGFGATYFDGHTPVPLADLKANIEFEMIGFRDPQHSKLMMTGYERSNLGPTLADHGANIEQDPYPAQNFFQRSDNYALARVGVVAHTISAFPTPPTYHQPTDTAASVDFPFMAASIQSLVEPVRWLLNSDFTPSWNAGGKP